MTFYDLNAKGHKRPIILTLSAKRGSAINFDSLQVFLSVNETIHLRCSIAQWLTHLQLDPAAAGSNHGSGVSFFREEICDVADLIDSALTA